MMQDVRRVFEIHTNAGLARCPECSADLSIDAGHRVDAAINHMLDHGWSLLHVGSEWDRDQQGQSISHTIAILGTLRDS
jgi:hypothetical protein